MRRYFIPEDCITPTDVVLSGDIFHHICVVCRQGLGDRFEVLQNETAYLVEIVTLQKKTAIAQIISQRQLPALPRPSIHLALSLPKMNVFETVLEKAVELGVHSVHPFHSDFSASKPQAKELDRKAPRWQKIIQSAVQQSGRGHWMELTEIQPLGVLLKEFALRPKAKGLLAYEGEGIASLKSELSEIPRIYDEVWIFVGSEGGFSPNDVKLFKDYNILPYSLGEQVLRVETACVALISILKYGLGHFDPKESE